MKKIISSVITVLILIGITVGFSLEIYATSMPKTSITKITALEESFKVEMKKADKITGYQVQYSTSSKFAKNSTKAVKTYNSYSSPKNLKGNQKYYVRVRTYKTNNKKTYYSAWSSTKSVTTKNKIPLKKLTVSPSSAKITTGKTLQLKTTLNPKNTSYKKLKFTSSDPKIATVSKNGVVKGLKAGKVQITVRALETNKKAVVNITIKKPYVNVKSMEITNKKGLTLEDGKKLKMTAKITPANATDKTIVWKTSDKTKATVDSKGNVTALRPTEFVEITASTKDGKVKASYKLKISRKNGYLKKSDLDKLNLSGVDNLMIIAHPDDETFWGASHILDGKYLVVSLTNGFHNERVKDFNSVIKRYGDDKGIILSYPDTRRYLYTADGKYNGYETDMWSTCDSGMKADISLLLNYKKWNTVVTHNPDGEYNKYHHKKVSEFVTKCIKSSKNSKTPLYYFGHYYSANAIIKDPKISNKNLRMKEQIIKMYLPTAQGAYDAFRHMLPYENWVLSSEW